MVGLQGVKLDAIGGVVLGAIPPVPVAALGDEQLFISQPQFLLKNAASVFIGLARTQQVLPGLVVLLGADPDIETGIDPGAAEYMIDGLRVADRQRLANSERLNVWLQQYPAVQRRP